MKNRLRHLVAGLLVAAFLSACGGGGGGNSDPGSSLTLSPSTVSANYQTGTSTTLTVFATISNPAVFSGTVYVVITDDKGVLSGPVSLTPISETRYSATLYTSASLATGVHSGVLQVRLCRDLACTSPYPGASASLNYTFTVSPKPMTATPTTNTTGTVYRGGSTTPTPVNVSVKAEGHAWTASKTAAWLQLFNAAGTGDGSFQAHYVPGSLAEGSYTDTVTVRTQDGQTATIPVKLNVLPAEFVLTSGTPSFSTINGRSITARQMDFALNNGVPTSWTATNSAPWLQVSPLSGSTTPAALTLQPDASIGPLASGSHSAEVVLSASGIPNRSVSVDLTLIKPTLGLSMPWVTLGGPKGRDLAPAQTVGVYLNTGSASWPFTLSGLPSWASSPTLSGTTNESGASLTITAGPTPWAGSGTANATLTATVNGDVMTTPLTINRNADQRRLLSSEWGVGFASTPTGNRLTRTLNISDNFGSALNWSAASNAAWLTVTSSGATPGAPTLTLTADPASLPVNAISYATVTVQTATAGVQPAMIRVALWRGSTAAAALPVSAAYTQLTADKIRPYIYANNGGSAIDVYNAYTGAKVRTFSNVGTALGAMSVSADGSRLYALEIGASRFAIVNLDTNTVLAPQFLSNPSTPATPVLAVRTNGVDVVLVGDGGVFTEDRALGRSNIGGDYFSGAFAMAATPDGRKLFTQNSGISPASGQGMDIDLSEISGGIFMMTSLGTVSHGSNGQDVAVSADGNRVYYASGSPYLCGVYDGALRSPGYLPGGDAYPTNVEVTSDGRVICGINGFDGTAFWVHSAAGALLGSYAAPGGSQHIAAKQLVVTPDGMVVALLADATFGSSNLGLVPIGP